MSATADDIERRGHVLNMVLDGIHWEHNRLNSLTTQLVAALRAGEDTTQITSDIAETKSQAEHAARKYIRWLSMYADMVTRNNGERE